MSGRADLLLPLLALVLAGCAAEPGRQAPLEPARQAYELLDRRTVVLGPGLEHGAGAQRLRTWIGDGGAVTHHLLVTARYQSTGWRYYEAAVGPDGAALPARSTDRSVGECARFSWAGCDHVEQVEVLLPDTLLRSAVDTGFDVTVAAREGRDTTVRVMPEQIAEQLRLVAAARK